MTWLTGFLDKCTTVLVGTVLCWSTVTHPTVDSMARRLILRDEGRDEVTIAEPAVDSGRPERGDHERGSRAGETSVINLVRSRDESPVSEQERIQEISKELKRLGATYLVLERVRQSNGVHYRARCDKQHGESAVQCHFEVTHRSKLAALECVLEALRSSVRQGIPPSDASSIY